MKYFSVDRIENDLYILETESKKYITVSKKKVDQTAKEGSVLFLTADGLYKVDEEKTIERKQALFQLQNQLFDSTENT